MPSDLPLELPPVKPWDQRANGILPLAGGYERYFDTLAWILQQCSDGQLDQGELQQRYMAAYSLDPYVALVQIQGLQKYGLLAKESNHLAATSPSILWLETRRADFIIGTMHANLKLVGELIQEVQLPRTRKSLLKTAVSSYGFGWQKDSQIAYRLGWLRSAGFAEQRPGNSYQATPAGLEFLEHIDVHQPDTTPPPDPPLPPPPEPLLVVGPHELARRLKTLSSDGKRHVEFELAVRDAFEFLGFEAEHLSGPGQTDVLLTATHAQGVDGTSPSLNWRYRVTVDSKAATGGRLTSNQVNWPALEKHRKQHDAQFSLLVGPGPAGQLLQFAADQAVGVLDASALSALVEAHASVPLATSAYFALFAGSDGNPRGGLIDTGVVESARETQVLRQHLVAQVFRAVASIAPSFKPPDAGLVHFNLSQVNSEQRISEALIAEALELLANQWLSAIAPVGDEGASARYVPAAPGHVVAQRLRWLADAFDEAAGDESETPETG